MGIASGRWSDTGTDLGHKTAFCANQDLKTGKARIIRLKRVAGERLYSRSICKLRHLIKGDV